MHGGLIIGSEVWSSHSYNDAMACVRRQRLAQNAGGREDKARAMGISGAPSPSLAPADCL